MANIVVDASAIIELLARRPLARHVEAALADASAHAPAHLDAEVVHGVRSLVLRGATTAARGTRAIERLVTFPARRLPLQPLVPLAWRLRPNLSGYDAFYVAVAEALECPLLTADRRLAATPKLPVAVTVLGT